MKTARGIESLLASVALCGATALALAQEDLALPPQLSDGASKSVATERTDGAPAADGPNRPQADGPGQARLAAQPKAGREPLEEVVVVGNGKWRLPNLPDLGSSWRQAHAQEKEGRIHIGITRLYDPASSPTSNDLFLANREIQRVGFLQLFQVHFGRGH